MSDKPIIIKRPRSHHPERVSLSPEALSRVNGWLELIRPKLKGTNFSRSEIVSWLLCNRSSDLTNAEIDEIAAVKFDPIKALHWAARTIQEKAKAGEQVDISEFLTGALGVCRQKPPRSKQKIAPKKLA